MDEEIPELSVDEAIKMLPEKEELHVFLIPSEGMLLGAHWPRNTVIEAIKEYGGAELSGDIASKMGHGIAIFHRSDWTWIETGEPKGDEDNEH